MKPRKNRLFRSIDFRNHPCLRVAVTCLAVSAIQLSSSAFAADFTWADSTGHTTWTSDASWVGGVAPDNSSSVNDNAIFTSASNAQPIATVLTRINGVDFQMPAGDLNFTGAGNFLVGVGGIDATAQISGTNTVAVSNIQLNAASTWNIFSNTNTAGTSTFTIDSTVNLNGNNLAINGKRNSTSGNVGVINFNGVISGDANISLHPDSFRTQTYFNALNTYNGTTNIRGYLNVNSLDIAGNASALGSSGNIVIGNSGSSAQLVFNNLVADSATDRQVLFQGTSSGGVFQITNNSAVGAVSFTNTDPIGAAASAATQDLNVKFGGTNTGLNTFGQVIDNRTNTTGITNVSKEGSGTWALTGINTYTGTTTITLGSLQLGNGGTTGSLIATTGITNNANLVVNRSNAFTQTTDLNGHVIAGSGSVTQAGIGATTLSAENTYTGTTTVSAGTVTVQNDQSSANGGWSIATVNGSGITAAANFDSSSTVSVTSGKNIQVGPSANSGSYPNSTLAVAGTVSNSGTLNVQRAGTLNLNTGASWTQDGDMTVSGRGGVSALLKINSGASMSYSGSNTVKINAAGNSGGKGTLNVDGTGLFTTAAGFENTTTATVNGYGRVSLTNGGTLRLSADVTDLTSQTQFELGTGGGVIDNGGFNTTVSGEVAAEYGPVITGIFGPGSLTSEGSGTLTLSGANTYTGNTIVSDGTLVVSETGSLFFAPTTNGVSNKVTGAGLLSVDGAFNLDLSGANVANGNAWTLVDSSSPVYDLDTFNVTSNQGDFAESPSGVHTLTDGGNTWTYTESTGQLTLSVSALSGYASWIGGFGLALADQDPTDDPDNDGMNNLHEFVLNGNPSLSDNSILPKLNVTATDFEFTYQRRDDSVSPETTQTFQWGTTLATWSGSAVIPATSGTVGVATITISAGIPNDGVTDTVKISIPKTEAGGSGKLFGRQQVVKP